MSAKSKTLPTIQPDRVLRSNDVTSITGLSRSTIYAWMKIGAFPQSVKLGERSVGWRESQVMEWITSRQAA